MKQLVTTGGRNPTPEPGKDIWLENGRHYTNDTVPSNYGRHDYHQSSLGIGRCRCGCVMGGYGSEGPVNPFGRCPAKPPSESTQTLQQPRQRRYLMIDDGPAISPRLRLLLIGFAIGSVGLYLWAFFRFA